MIPYKILKGVQIAIVCMIIIESHTPLWGQTTNTDELLEKSPYSSKVFSEIDHLVRIARKNLSKHLTALQRDELAAIRNQGLQTANSGNLNRANFQTSLAGQDTLAKDEKDVVTLSPNLPFPLQETIEIPQPLTPGPRLLFKEDVALVSVNIYTEKNREEINKYLIAKLESTYLKKFPRFSFYKNEEFFKHRYEELDDSYVFSYGPQNNAEITETVEARGGRYYARVYFFRLSDRSIVDLNIYDAKTHELVWGKRQSMYVSFKESSLSYRLLVGLSAEKNAGLFMTNFIGIRLPVAGIYGIFFSFGTIAVDPNGSQFYFSYATVDAILISISIGPQISYSLNELFGFSYHCCEFFIDFQFGYKNNIAINATDTYLESNGTIQQNFATILGTSISIRKFIVYFNYDPLNNVWGAGGGFNF